MQQHQFVDHDGVSWCRHCGALQNRGTGLSCVERPDPSPQARPRRLSALDDVDALRTRLDELAHEREAAVADGR